MKKDPIVGTNRRKTFSLICCGIAACIFGYAFFLYGSFYLFLTAILSLTGIMVSVEITKYVAGRTTAFSQALCDTEKSGCHTVLDSKMSVFFGIAMADLGVVYFAGLFLLQFQFLFSDPGNSAVIIIPVSLSFIAVLIFLVYQGFVIKAWCKMCLLISVIVILQSAIAGYLIYSNKLDLLYSLKKPTCYLVLISSFLISSLWIILKHKQPDAVTQKAIDELQWWKSQPDFFYSLLKKQKQRKIDLWADDIIQGSKDPVLQIVCVVNPYCKFCKLAHAELLKILNRFPEEVMVVTRFKAPNKEKIRVKTHAALNFIYSLYFSNTHLPDNDLMGTWFAKPSIRKQKADFPNLEWNKNSYKALIEKNEIWSFTNHISFTPAILINGHKLPKQYSVNDLFDLLVNTKDFHSLC